MTDHAPPSPVEQELATLEGRIDELMRRCARLRDENRSLRTQQEELLAERSRLVEKNELARVRVEAMINRLKSMEHEP